MLPGIGLSGRRNRSRRRSLHVAVRPHDADRFRRRIGSGTIGGFVHLTLFFCRILSISAYYDESTAALVVDGKTAQNPAGTFFDDECVSR